MQSGQQSVPLTLTAEHFREILNPRDFDINIGELEAKYFNGRKSDELTFGFIIEGTTLDDSKRMMFVGSRFKQYRSAAILAWWRDVIGSNIDTKTLPLIRDIYAQKWFEESPTGRHPVCSLISNCVHPISWGVTITPIKDVIEQLWGQYDITEMNLPDAHKEAIRWTVDLDETKRHLLFGEAARQYWAYAISLLRLFEPY